MLSKIGLVIVMFLCKKTHNFISKLRIDVKNIYGFVCVQVSFKSEFKDELKFIAKCRGSTKPAKKKVYSADNSNRTGSNQYVNESDRHYDYES